jgi:uncharacterized protein (TIRG00374 family)
MPSAPADAMPQELSPRHLRKRLLELLGVIVVVVLVILLVPGLNSLRMRIAHASAGWVVAAGVVELLSTLSYVVVFRAVFCQRMSWRMSYQIGMAEQAANALVPAGGAGGLALGAWALSRGGMSAGHIARRTVAFFVLTSLANFVTLVVFAAAFAVGLFGHDRPAAFTFAFGAAALLGIAITLLIPRFGSRLGAGEQLPKDAGRIHTLVRRFIEALTYGVRDSIELVRQRPIGVNVGSFGYMGFDIAALGFSFLAFHYTPPFGVLIVAYLIGQLGGLLPIPIGGIEGGLLGTFALYHVPLSAAAAAVLVYRGFQLWLPGLLGSVAFIQLRRSLRREKSATEACKPLAEPIQRPRRSARGPLRRTGRPDRTRG